MPDFDQPFDPARSRSEKWDRDALTRTFGSDEVLPFWIADMDFSPSPAITKRLSQRVDQGTFAYETKPLSLINAVLRWNASRHDWTIDASDVRLTAGTMYSITQLLALFTNELDGVIIQPPVYFQFQHAIQGSGRTVVPNPLRLANGRYEMDLDDLEEKAADPSTKVLLLCNPHNPVGRVWNRDELQHVADICLRHEVLVISDEVHGDFVFSNHTYTPFLSLSHDATENAVSCLSPAKPFNIPAIASSISIIPNQSLRNLFDRQTNNLMLNHIHALSCVATEAAYGEMSEAPNATQWLDAAIGYVEKNADFLCKSIKDRIPGVDVITPEGTFLAWLDFRQLGLSVDPLDAFLANDAKIALKAGHFFGPSGEGFCRMSIGCSRALLEEAVERLEKAIGTLGLS